MDTPFTTVAIIGAGMSGIGMTARLKIAYGLDDVQIFEKGKQEGGTWAYNTYPGCACDVPSPLYSFSFEQNPNWSRMNPSQDETKEYVQAVARKYGVPERTRYGTAVTKCEWIAELQRWRIHANDVETGEEIVHESKILVSAVGVLDIPNDTFDVPGKEKFKGKIMHTARWDRSVPVEGKNIVVLGNGCTGAQLVPALLNMKAKFVLQLFRTKHWFEPSAIVEEYSQKSRDLWRKYPSTLWLYRFIIFLVMEKSFLLYYNHWLGRWYRKRRQATVRKHMEKAAPPEYHDRLIPDFDFGCKRRVMEYGYLSCLSRPDVDIRQECILSISEDAVTTPSGTYAADIIALATGFKTNKYMYGITVTGENGRDLHKHWDQHGGPSAYNCSLVAGFPNFFMMLGPNSSPGHTSALMFAENNINYAINVIRPIIRGDASAVSVTPKADRKFSQDLQNALRNRVWSNGCGSWYERGGTNASSYPYTSFWYWWRSKWVEWGDLHVQWTEKGKRD